MFLLLAALAGGVAAHPFVTRNVRVVHFATAADGSLVAYFRLDAATGSWARSAGRGPGRCAARGTVTLARRESGATFWYADIAAITRDPVGLGRLIVTGHTIAAKGVAPPGVLLSVAVHPKGYVPPFDSVAQRESR